MIVELKFHRKRCNTCKHYSFVEYGTRCNHPTKGRDLTIVIGGGYADYARYCSDWAKKQCGPNVGLVKPISNLKSEKKS